MNSEIRITAPHINFNPVTASVSDNGYLYLFERSSETGELLDTIVVASYELENLSEAITIAKRNRRRAARKEQRKAARKAQHSV
jgi:hypothetical protein